MRPHVPFAPLLAMAALAAQAVVGPSGPRAVVWLAAAVTLALAVSARRAHPAAFSVTVLCASMAVASCAGVSLRLPWQATMMIALSLFALAGRAWGALRPSRAWRSLGRVPVVWTAIVAGLTPVALSIWMVLFKPDLRDVLEQYVPPVPLSLLVIGGVIFAFVNAGLEELIWRGVMQDRLEAVFGPQHAIVLQALSFGFQHAWGVPRGVAGVLLAGVWALMLGMLRRHAGGLLAPFIAHVVADATIAVIVLAFLR